MYPCKAQRKGPGQWQKLPDWVKVSTHRMWAVNFPADARKLSVRQDIRRGKTCVRKQAKRKHRSKQFSF
jgi:hypothetical protein